MTDLAGIGDGADSGPGGGVVEAARVALGDRLRVLPKLLRRAARRGDERPEAVHRLRVATRRAAAALDAFDPLVHDRKALRSLRKMLTRARRAAAAARACDVHAAALDARIGAGASAEECAALGALLARVHEQRADAQRALRRYRRAFSRSAFEEKSRRVIESVCDCGAGISVGAWAEVGLSAALVDVRGFDGPEPPTIAQWHELRLALKRLRYRAELFEPYDASGACRAMQETASHLQDRLGVMNDLEELSVLIADAAESMPGTGPVIARGLERLGETVGAERAAATEEAGAMWARVGGFLTGRGAGGSTPSVNGPMMDLDTAMESALERAREVLDDRGEAG